MSADTFVVIALIAGFGYWLYVTQKQKTRGSAVSTTIKTPDVPSSSAAQPTSMDDQDPFLAEIVEERQRADAEVHEARAKYEGEMESQFDKDLQLKARLEKFAREQGLDQAIHELYETIQYFPAWSQRGDWDQHNVLGLEGPVTETQQDANNKTIAFQYKGQHYGLATRQWSGMEGDAYVDFCLFEDGDEKFSVSCRADYTEWGRHYKPISIDAFKKRGNWASLLLETQKLKRIQSNKIMTGLKYHKADEIQQRFKE